MTWLSYILVPGAAFPYLIGMLTMFYWCKSPKSPADSSNRINNIKSWWIGLTRPDVLATCYRAQQMDVLDQLEEINKN